MVKALRAAFPATILIMLDYLSVGIALALPELVWVILVVLLSLWKRNNLISIIGGTVIYMIIVS